MIEARREGCRLRRGHAWRRRPAAPSSRCRRARLLLVVLRWRADTAARRVGVTADAAAGPRASPRPLLPPGLTPRREPRRARGRKRHPLLLWPPVPAGAATSNSRATGRRAAPGPAARLPLRAVAEPARLALRARAASPVVVLLLLRRLQLWRRRRRLLLRLLPV